MFVEDYFVDEDGGLHLKMNYTDSWQNLNWASPSSYLNLSGWLDLSYLNKRCLSLGDHDDSLMHLLKINLNGGGDDDTLTIGY